MLIVGTACLALTCSVLSALKMCLVALEGLNIIMKNHLLTGVEQQIV
jgi:hypothetical protein